MNLLSHIYTYMAVILSGHLNEKIIDRYSKFIDFRDTYGKVYETFEDTANAFSNFMINMDRFDQHNAFEAGYSMGITQFADMSPEDFDSFKGGCFAKDLSSRTCVPFTPNSNVLPESIDWRNIDAVTDVKNQGQCGSCWSFSATGAMEGAWAVKTGELVSLSEQQLVDCSAKYGNNGCNGGLMDSAFEYVIDNGLCDENQIPYKAVDGKCETCPKSAVKFSSCVDVTPRNQLHLKQAVAMGPVSIAIEADTSVFQHYTGGIISSSLCGTQLDHGVLIVGYGTDNGVGYWIVKNSWGDSWGENGYIKIARSESDNDAGVCGIAMQPSYPVC